MRAEPTLRAGQFGSDSGQAGAWNRPFLPPVSRLAGVVLEAARGHDLPVDSLRLTLLQVDWDSLDHAYGPAGDAPGQLLALVGDDPETRGRTVGYLDAAMLHQGTICSATAPFIKIVAGLVTDPRSAVPVADVLPWDPEPRPLRLALLDYLALVAQACRFSVADIDLIHDAYPAGRDETDLQRIYRAARDCAWRLDPDPATRKPLPPALVEALEDKEYREAMRARPVLACRKVVPAVFEAVLPLITGPDSAVRTAAMIAAAYCLGHAALGDRKAAFAELLADTAAVSPEPRERAAVARLLGMLGHRPQALLRDEHPACAPVPRSRPGSPAMSVPPVNWSPRCKRLRPQTSGSPGGCPARKAGSTVTSRARSPRGPQACRQYCRPHWG